MKQKVGFLGLGIMGAAMAANIARAGYDLVVYNRTPGKAGDLTRLGAREAVTPRALAEGVDVVVAMVTGPDALDELLWGPEGLGEALDASKVFINMSTVSPAYTRELNGRLEANRVKFIDAPVSGSKKPAEEGSLLILAGGAKEDVEAMTPLLETMGKKVIFCGPVGQGSMMKMVINLLLGIMMEGLAESVNLGMKGGLSPEAIMEVVLGGPLNCALFQLKSGMIRQNEFPANFPLKHMTKDLKLVSDTAYELGAPLPAGHAMLDAYRTAVGQGWGDLDFAAVWKAIEYLNPSP